MHFDEMIPQANRKKPRQKPVKAQECASLWNSDLVTLLESHKIDTLDHLKHGPPSTPETAPVAWHSVLEGHDWYDKNSNLQYQHCSPVITMCSDIGKYIRGRAGLIGRSTTNPEEFEPEVVVVRGNVVAEAMLESLAQCGIYMTGILQRRIARNSPLWRKPIYGIVEVCNYWFFAVLDDRGFAVTKHPTLYKTKPLQEEMWINWILNEVVSNWGPPAPKLPLANETRIRSIMLDRYEKITYAALHPPNGINVSGEPGGPVPTDFLSFIPRRSWNHSVQATQEPGPVSAPFIRISQDRSWNLQAPLGILMPTDTYHVPQQTYGSSWQMDGAGVHTSIVNPSFLSSPSGLLFAQGSQGMNPGIHPNPASYRPPPATSAPTAAPGQPYPGHPLPNPAPFGAQSTAVGPQQPHVVTVSIENYHNQGGTTFLNAANLSSVSGGTSGQAVWYGPNSQQHNTQFSSAAGSGASHQYGGSSHHQQSAPAPGHHQAQGLGTNQ